MNRLFEDFVEDDIKNNRGLIINQYREIEHIINTNNTECIVQGYLDNLLTHTVENSSFYSDYVNYKCIYDFPVVNKQILKENTDLILVPRFRDREDNKVKHTSGSTGTPFEVVWDHRKHCRMIADAKFFSNLGGVFSHESIVCWVQKDKHESSNPERERKDNVYTIFCTYFDDESIAQLLEKTTVHDPKGIIAYASMWDAVANYIYRGKADRCSFQLTAIYAEAESLNERSREILEKYFQCKVYSRYGNEECGILAQEDDTGRGFLLETASYYFELLALDKDEPVKEGQIGRLVLTDLFNYVFPMIRYDTGDLATVVQCEDGKLYLKDLIGRKEDLVFDSQGRLVNPHTCLVFMKYFYDIMQFQLIQEDFSHFIWRLNTDNQNLEDEIIRESKEILGQDAVFKFEYVDKLEKMKSGKVPRIINRIKKV